MDDLVDHEPMPAAVPRSGWVDARYLLFLVAIVLGFRAWQMCHTEVASRDCMLFIRMAWQLEHDCWRDVLSRGPQHPGYPLCILAVSWPVRHWIADLPQAMQVSSQLASGLASLLLLFPMYFYGRTFFGSRASFWACLLFQCLPASGRVLGDGLSEGLFLTLVMCSLGSAVRAMHGGSWIHFSLCGLFSGLAYLTRPEGALVAASAGLVLLLCQIVPAHRRPWRTVLVAGSGLSLAACLVAVPYMIVIGGLTAKNTGNSLMNRTRKDADFDFLYQNPLREEERAAESPRHCLTLGTFLPLAMWDEQAPFDLGTNRTAWALRAFFLVLTRGFFYFAWVPALLGAWWFRDRFRDPAVWVSCLLCLILMALLFRVAQRMGYLSDRHLLLVILLGCFFAAAALLRLGELMKNRLAGGREGQARSWAGACSLGLLLLLVVPPLARTLQPLHSERVGFREVGRWLAGHTPAGDLVIDPYCWSYYYAGRMFVEGCKNLPRTQPRCFYVVLEESQNSHPHLVGLSRAREWAQQGQVLERFSIPRGKHAADIIVYQVPLPLR